MQIAERSENVGARVWLIDRREANVLVLHSRAYAKKRHGGKSSKRRGGSPRNDRVDACF